MDNPASLVAPTATESNRIRHSHAKLHALMCIPTFCWAANIVAVKEGLLGFSALALMQLRVAGAATIFVVLYLLRKRVSDLHLPRRDWVIMVVLGVCGVTLNQLCFIGGLARSTVAHAGLVVALGPIMVLVIACAIGLEALTVSKFAGMLIAFTGVAVLTLSKTGRGGGGYWVGDLILLAGSAFFAIYTILVKEVADKYDALTLNTLPSVFGVPLLVPIATHALTSTRWESVPTHAWLGLGYTIVFGSVVPYLIFAVVLRELSAARVAAFSYIQPVIATGLGFWLLHERLTLKVIVGGILILGGVYLTERERGEEVEIGSRE